MTVRPAAHRCPAWLSQILGTMGARRNGVDLQTRVISFFRYRDGRRVERWLYPDYNAAWNLIFAA